MICHRCRIKPAEYICKECNSSLCNECDNFVHSSLKRSHNRGKVPSPEKMNSPSSELNTNYDTNLNIYSNRLQKEKNFENEINENDKYYNYDDIYSGFYLSSKQNKFSNISPEKLYYPSNNSPIEENKNNNLYDLYNNYNNNDNNKIKAYRSKSNSHNNSFIKNKILATPNVSSKCINQIKEIYEQERKGLISKINKLTQKLNDTKINMTERIDYLHKHLYETENKHKLELNESKYNNGIETKRLEDEKNLKIDKLQSIINSQNDTINDLELKIKNFEEAINEKENIYLKRDRDIDNILNEKKELENYFKDEIEQINKKHNEEKENLISEYEQVIRQLSSELDTNKKNYAKALVEIAEKENIIKNMVNEVNNEKLQMDDNVMKLKEKSSKDQRNLMKLNYELKLESDNKSEVIDRLKTEIQNLNEENEKMKSRVKKMKKINSEMKLTNIKLNNVVKNKFK